MKLIQWAAAEEVDFNAEAEVITAEEAAVAAEEYFIVDVDEEADITEEAGKNQEINSPDPMPEWCSDQKNHNWRRAGRYQVDSSDNISN